MIQHIPDVLFMIRARIDSGKRKGAPQLTKDRRVLAKAEEEIIQLRQQLQQAEDFACNAKRLALELECLLMDTKDLPVQSKWWDSAHEALELFRKAGQ